MFALSVNAQVNFIWGKQFGSDNDEKARNIISDTLNNVYVFGKTKGEFGGETFGKQDGFVVKIDSAANIVWKVQIGSKYDDDIKQATVDASGNIYITGQIGIDRLDSSENNDDVLVSKINSSGAIVWQKQFGTDSMDVGRNIIVVPNGDLYVIGDTKGVMGIKSEGKTDCFILHLDNDGNQLNVIQFGSPGDDGLWGVTVGIDSRIYVCGSVGGKLVNEITGVSDAFLGIYTKQLEQIKIRQFGAHDYDFALAIKTDSKSNIYIAGNTGGDFGAKQEGGGDCFLLKIDETEEVKWIKQFGTKNWDGINGLDIFQDNKVVVSGCMNYPFCQSFCRMYTEDGDMLWERKYVASGKGGGTCGKGITMDRKGYMYHGGYTGANLFSNLRGKHDIYVIKLKLTEVL